MTEGGFTRGQFLKRGTIGAGLLLSGNMLGACADEGGGGDGGEVKLVLLAPLTGVAAAWGPLQADGFKRAVDAFNETGGVKVLGGAKMKLEVRDTETKPEVAATQAQRAAEDASVVAITGCNQSGASIIVSRIAHQAQVPFITGTDADPEIVEQGSEFSFRIVPSTEAYPRDMLEWIKTVGETTGTDVTKLAVLSSSSALGQTANRFAKQHAERLGFDIVAIETYDTENTRDFSSQVSRFKSQGVNVLLGTHDPEPGVLLIRALRQQNWAPNILGGMYGTIGTPDWIKAVGENASNYSYNAWPWVFNVKGLGMEQFTSDFKQRHNQDPTNFDSPGYSVVSLLADALERAGDADRVKVRDALRQTNLEAGSGPVPLMQMGGARFAPNGDNTNASNFVGMVKDAQTVVVSPEQYATEEAVIPHPGWKS